MSRQFRLILWFFFGLIFGGVSVYAHAETIAATKLWPGYNQTWTSSFQTACESWWTGSGQTKTYYGATNCSGDTCTCAEAKTGLPWCPAGVTCGSASGPVLTKEYQCPTGQNWTLSGSSCTRSDCVAPDVRNPDTGICESISCDAGQSSSATRHTGCYSVDGIDNGCDAGTPLPTPTTLCDGSCWVNLSGVSGCTSPPGGGPITCTYTGTLSGSSCSPSDIPAQPAPTDKCPAGYAIGSVNGVSGCYKTGSQPPETTTTTSSTSGDTTTTVKTTTNTTTNTTTTTTTTTNNVTGTTTTSTQITPTDPAKPILDPSQKSPGEDQTPWEIDESGTPTDGSLSAQKADYEAKATERKNYIESLGNQGNHGLTWDWAFELPGGTCTAYSFTIASKTFTLDPCDKLYMIRDILGFLIYITTALALLSIATGYGKEGK